MTLFRPTGNSQALIQTLHNRTAGGIGEILTARERSNKTNMRGRGGGRAAETLRDADAAGDGTVAISRPLGRPKTLFERLHPSPPA